MCRSGTRGVQASSGDGIYPVIVYPRPSTEYRDLYRSIICIGLLAVLMCGTSKAADSISPQIPEYDADRRCDIQDGRSQTIVKQCVESERLFYTTTKRYWDRISSTERHRCIEASRRSETKNYEILNDCLMKAISLLPSTEPRL